MEKLRTIASAKHASGKKPLKEEESTEEPQEVANREDEVTGSDVGSAPGHGSGAHAEEKEEEKLSLVPHNVAVSKLGSSLSAMYVRAAMAGKKFTSNIGKFFAQMQKLPLQMRSHFGALKMKCAASFKRSALCLRTGFPEEERTDPEVISAHLNELGINVNVDVLLLYRSFKWHELDRATSHFAQENKLGSGSSGSVYKGVLASSGERIAVKLLNVSSKDAQLSFATELKIMSRVHNRYIQPVLGYCVEDSRLLLVYTYMPQGSLDGWIHGLRKHSKLSWKDRRKVAFGITEALRYLHMECHPPIIHRDLKSANILLTKDKDAKLTDFGFAVEASEPESFSEEIVGTLGHQAPEYLQSGILSTKIDIFSFGIVLLELMTGRWPVDGSQPPEQANLGIWAQQQVISTQNFTAGMSDPALKGIYPPTCMQRLLCVALLCIHPLASQRPTSSEVLKLLQEEPGSLQAQVHVAYEDTSSHMLTLPGMNQDKGSRKKGEDLMKQLLQTAMHKFE